MINVICRKLIQSEYINWNNPSEDKEEVLLEEYVSVFKSIITQGSETLYVNDQLFVSAIRRKEYKRRSSTISIFAFRRREQSDLFRIPL